MLSSVFTSIQTCSSFMVTHIQQEVNPALCTFREGLLFVMFMLSMVEAAIIDTWRQLSTPNFENSIQNTLQHNYLCFMHKFC